MIIGDHNLQVTGDGCRITLVDPRDLPKPRPLPQPVFVRPRAPEPFVGRRAELAQLEQLLQRSRAVEVVGPSGVGKSWLLRRLAQETPESAPAGSVFAAAPVTALPVEDVARELFDCFYERFSSSSLTYHPTRAELRRGLTELRARILLDDLELAPPELRALLDYLGSAQVVYTCANRTLPEAQELRLAGLDQEATLGLAGERVLAGEPPPEESRHRYLLLLFVLANGAWLAADTLLGLAGELLQLPAEAIEPITRKTLQELHAAGMLQADPAEAPASALRFRAPASVVQAHAAAPGLRDVAVTVLSACSRWDRPPRRAELPLLLGTLKAARGLKLERELSRCIRATEPLLILAGALGLWQTVLELHREAATALQDTAELAWSHHESGVAALSQGDPLLAQQSFELARQLSAPGSKLAGLSEQAQQLAPGKLPLPAVKAVSALKMALAGAALSVAAVVGVVAYLQSKKPAPPVTGGVATVASATSSAALVTTGPSLELPQAVPPERPRGDQAASVNTHDTQAASRPKGGTQSTAPRETAAPPPSQCSTPTTCNACIHLDGGKCGWCWDSKRCGASQSMSKTCPVGSYATTPSSCAIDCSTRKDCATCASDLFCAWIPAVGCRLPSGRPKNSVWGGACP